MRLIDADALEEILEKIPAADIKNMGGQAYVLVKLSQVFNVIDNQPTIEPRKKGKWIPVTRIEEWHEEEGLVGFPPEVKEFPQCTIKWVDATEPDEVDGLRCSECDTVYDFTEARNWCSECGAEMTEPEDIPMEYFESGGR